MAAHSSGIMTAKAEDLRQRRGTPLTPLEAVARKTSKLLAAMAFSIVFFRTKKP
jgi:hypothetical protein